MCGRSPRSIDEVDRALHDELHCPDKCCDSKRQENEHDGKCYTDDPASSKRVVEETSDQNTEHNFEQGNTIVTHGRTLHIVNAIRNKKV